MARMGSAAAEDLDRKIDVPIQTLIQPTIAKDVVVLALGVVLQWAEELVGYFREDFLPANKQAAIQLKAGAA